MRHPLLDHSGSQNDVSGVSCWDYVLGKQPERYRATPPDPRVAPWWALVGPRWVFLAGPQGALEEQIHGKTSDNNYAGPWLQGGGGITFYHAFCKVLVGFMLLFWGFLWQAVTS